MPGPDFISHAARFWVLAEQAFRSGWPSDNRFWFLSAPLAVETAIHLPVLTAVVRRRHWLGILESFAFHPLPDVLPPEAVRWHDQLVAAWEVYRASSDDRLQNIARLALVRLDGCGMPDGHERPSRLPEWLAEAQKIASGHWRGSGGTYGEWGWYLELEALAALATWHPSPRVITRPQTLRKWATFFLEMHESDDFMVKGLAAIALLNLSKDTPRAASIPRISTTELFHQLTTAIEVTAERADRDQGGTYLFLLDWQRVKGTTWLATEARRVARAWLEVTRYKAPICRLAAWQQLIRWDRAGSLDTYGIDLLPALVKAVPTEKDAEVLWEMAQWVPSAERFTATETSDRLSLLWELEKAWERYRGSGNSWNRASAWLAGIRLHQAGLASEPAESFLNAYLSEVADEQDEDLLFILAQWSPGAAAPGRWHRDWHAGWQQRLLDKNGLIRQIAAGAFLRQPMEKEDGRSLRCPTLELWRAGTKASSEVRDILGAVFARFQEVRTRLATGEVPDFEAKPTRPAERHRPPLVLPPGRIAGREWSMENEELKMENAEWTMKHPEATPKPNPRRVPDRPSRSGMSES